MASDERRELRLRRPQDYAYLNKSGCYTIPNVDDATDYFRLSQSLQQIGWVQCDDASSGPPHAR